MMKVLNRKMKVKLYVREKNTMENLTDCYTVMKITGDMIDECGKNGTAHDYWDLNNLWWSAASIYVPEMKRLNNLSGPSN